ncbi:MarR family winged helix-turn-helix transcriptional regulator [Sphingobacterium rhinopitheci]|uniref:MarR family winged helix-turn-helix transcriptional regulator n=1 Tax=Sphingobacterium rhinopitheci TaxID=2781960 RepID=UPI001F51C818|nr:MarR family transcriptional regulator [Sphingobacterium rhinopitheci]MCI0920382.1 MarR family transcriptional regulator [Sphingobacterium rhinopitheci]
MNQNKTIDYLLKSTWQTVVNKYNTIASQHGFTQAAGYILINIHKEGTSVSQIANATGVKTTSLSRILNNLECLGFIYREVNEDDKRSVKVYLTPLGVEKRKIAKDVVRGFNTFLEKQLSEKERLQLENLLVKVNGLALSYEDRSSVEA